MHELLPGIHAHTSAPPLPGFIAESLHHRSMRQQHVCRAHGVELRVELIGGNGVLHLLNFAGRGNNILSLNHIAHLLFAQLVALNSEGGVNRAHAVSLAKAQPVLLLQADSIALHQRRNEGNLVDCLGRYLERGCVGHRFHAVSTALS